MSDLSVFDGGNLSVDSQKSLVNQMTSELLLMDQADIVTTHRFLPGIYERTITIPPWTVLTGAAHKTAYKVRLERGVIAVNTDGGVKTLVGPVEFDVEAGFQRAGRVFDEEVVWVDVYKNPDNCRNIDLLEDRLYEVPSCGMGEKRALNNLALSAQGDEKWLDG